MRRKDPFTVTAKGELTVTPKSTIRMSGTAPLKPPVKKPKIVPLKKKKQTIIAPKKFVIKNEFLDIAKEQGIIKTGPKAPLKGIPGEFNIDRLARFNVTADVKATDIKAINELQVPIKIGFPQFGAKAPGNIIFHDTKRNFYGFDCIRWWPFIQGIADVLEYNNDAGGYDIFNLGTVYAQNFVGNQVSMERINYPTSAINPNVVVSIVDGGQAGIFNYANLISTDRPFVASNVRGTSIKLNNKNEVAAVGITDNSPINFYNGIATTAATMNVNPIFGIYSSYVVKYDSDGNYTWSTFISGVDQNNLPRVGLNKFNDVVTCGVYNSELEFYSSDNNITPSYTLGPLLYENAYLAVYNYSGVFQWATRISGMSIPTDAYELARDVVINDLGDILLVGTFNTNPLAIYEPNTNAIAATLPSLTGGFHAYLVKFNKFGVFQWATVITGSTPGVTEGLGVDVNESGDIVVCGAFSAPILNIYDIGGFNVVATIPRMSARENFLVKYNSAGDFQWATGVAGDVNIPQVSINEGGNIVMSIYSGSTLTSYAVDIYATGGTLLVATLPAYSSSNAFIVRYTNEGVYQYGTVIGNVASGYPFDISINDINRIVVSGGYTSNLNIYNSGGTALVKQLENVGGNDAFVIVYDNILNYQWVSKIAGLEEDQSFAVSLNNINAVALTGFYSQLANIYDGSGNIVGFLPFKLNGTDAFIVRFTDEIITLSLANPALDAQQKLILSTGPDVLIVPFATVDGLDQNIQLSANQYVHLIWDAGQLNWNTLYNTGEGLLLAGNLNMNGFDITNADNINAQEIDVLNMNVTNNLFAGNVTAGNITASLLVGNLSSLQRLNYPDTEISTDTLYTIIESGILGQAGWGARIVNSNVNNSVLGLSTAINNLNEIVGTGIYNLSSIIIYSANGLTAFTLELGGGTWDTYLVKYDIYGLTQWTARISSANDEWGRSVDINDSGDIVVSGFYKNLLNIYNSSRATAFTLENSGATDTFVVKYATNGIAIWGARITNVLNFITNSIAINNSGEIVVGGYSQNLVTVYNAGGSTAFTLAPTTGSLDAFVIKYSSNGIATWGAKLSDSVYNYGIDINNNGDIVITGFYYNDLIVYKANSNIVAFTLPGNSGNTDAFVIQYSSQGIPSWGARIGGGTGIEDDFGLAVSLNDNGNIIVSGNYQSSPLYVYNSDKTLAVTLDYDNLSLLGFVVNYSSNGTANWATRLVNNYTRCYASINNSDDIIVAGDAGSDFSFGTLAIYNANRTTAFVIPAGIFIVKFDTKGNAIWSTRLIDNYTYACKGVDINTQGNIIITGGYRTELAAYNANSNTIAFTLQTPGNFVDGAYIIKYTNDQLSVHLQNPSIDGQPKTITSAGPQISIQATTINNISTTLQLFNGESVQLFWDAVNKTWVNKENIVMLSAGSSNKPSLTFLDDLDTGISSPNKNNISFNTGGNERVRIDSSGRIGIGTTSPSKVIEAYVPNGANEFRIRSDNMSIGMGINSGNTFGFIYNRNNFNLVFGTNDLPRLTIRNNGVIEFNAYGAGALSTNASGVISASSGTFKTRTRSINNGIELINQLQPTYYHYNKDTPFDDGYEHLGFFAEEIGKVIPEASPECGPDKFRNYYDRAIVAVSVKALQELHQRIEILEDKIEQYEARFAKLERNL